MTWIWTSYKTSHKTKVQLLSNVQCSQAIIRSTEDFVIKNRTFASYQEVSVFLLSGLPSKIVKKIFLPFIISSFIKRFFFYIFGYNCAIFSFFVLRKKDLKKIEPKPKKKFAGPRVK